MGVQERAEAKHDNKWILPKWESKTTFLEWDDFLLDVIENDKLSTDNHITIQYLLREQEAPTTTSDIPDGLNHLEVLALQVPLEGSAYDANNKELYSKLFR